jgi:hypothetical protein
MTLQELFATDGSWTQGAYARTLMDRPIDPTAPAAVRFCLDGALSRCFHGRHAERIAARDRLMDRIGNIAHWNDAPQRTIADVRQLVAELNL